MPKDKLGSIIGQRARASYKKSQPTIITTQVIDQVCAGANIRQKPVIWPPERSFDDGRATVPNLDDTNRLRIQRGEVTFRVVSPNQDKSIDNDGETR